MISNLSKILTIQLPPFLTLISTFLILFTFLSPVPIHGSISMITIAPGMSAIIPQTQADSISLTRRFPRAAAYALVQRAKSETASGVTLNFGLLGSCSQHSGESLKCTTSSLTPTYDLSALPDNLQFITTPPQTSPHWTLVSLLCLIVFVLLTTIPSIPRVPSAVTNFASKPIYSRTAAWIGILGWATGIACVIVLHVNFDNAATTFNTATANDKVELLASLGNGFTLFWVAYALTVPSLICVLFKLQLETKAV